MKPNVYFFNQRISITHSIPSVFHTNPPLEVCGVFPDIAKTLTQFGWKSSFSTKDKLTDHWINGNILNLINSFFHNSRQTLVLNGLSSHWKCRKTGVSQGSISEIFSYL